MNDTTIIPIVLLLFSLLLIFACPFPMKDKFKQILKWFQKQWAVNSVVLILLVLLLLYAANPFNVVDWFFGENKRPSEIIQYIGVICGGIIVLGTLYASNKRNYLTEKGQLDTRFKDAAQLLASENTSAILSGIYALHQIAIEASKGDDSQKGYVKIIQDIFCAFLRENSEQKDDVTKPKIVSQTIIDVLFDGDKQIYNQESMDFSHTNLASISFHAKKIERFKGNFSHLYSADFSEATINNAEFYDANMNDTNFSKAKITNTFFEATEMHQSNFEETIFKDVVFVKTKMESARMEKACFINVGMFIVKLSLSNLTSVKCLTSQEKPENASLTLDDVDLSEAYLTEADLRNAHLNKVDLSDSRLTLTDFSQSTLSGVDFSNAKICEVDFSDAKIDDKTNFSNTNLSGLTISDIVKPGNSKIKTTPK